MNQRAPERAAGAVARPAVAGPGVAEIWRTKLQKALSQPYLVALMIGSLLLSAASFFTTFDGMLNFMPLWAVTFCIVFAIQALLFVASWRLGFAFADRETPPFFTAFVFIICLATSVFFSAVSLFESINDAETQERTRTTRMHRAVEETAAATQARAEAESRARAEAVLADPGFDAWSRQLGAVAEAAFAARETLDAARDLEAADFAAQARALEDEKAALLQDGAAAAARGAAKEREAARLEQSRGDLVERIKTLRAERDAAEVAVVRKTGQMQAEEKGGASGAGAGRGAIWRGLRDEREVLRAEFETKETLLTAARRDLEEADARTEALRAEIAAAKAGGGGAQLALIDARLTQLKQRIAAIQAGEGGDVAAEAAAMRRDLGRFETGLALADLDAAAARCASLLESLRGHRASAEGAGALSCDMETLAAPLSRLRLSIEAGAALAARCAPGGARASVISELDFKAAAAYGRECAAISGLPAAALADLRGEIDRLILEEDEKASQFVKTVNAWSAGDKLSYFALAIALFIDLLVLLSGLIGAVSVTSAMGRAFGKGFAKKDIEDAKRALAIKSNDPFAIARAILETIEPSAAKGFVGELDIAAAPEDLRGGVRQFLLTQCEKKLAEVKGLKARRAGAEPPAGKATVFLIKERLLAALRAYLEETALEQEEAAQRGAGRPAADDYAYLLDQLGAPEKRAATLDAAFRALKPPSTPEPRRLLAASDWVRARSAAELRFKDARAAIKTLAEETGAPAGVDLADLRRLGFALYRRGLARPLPMDEKSGETPGYRLTDRALSLMEAASLADRPAPSPISQDAAAAFPAPEAPKLIEARPGPALALTVDNSAEPGASGGRDNALLTPMAEAYEAQRARFGDGFLESVAQRRRAATG